MCIRDRFNTLTGESKDVAQGAFTTLTTSTRAVQLPEGRILLSDTVGFISRLPTYMIEAFKSTLEELVYSNLVLLVVDASEPIEDMVRKYRSCVDVLLELGVSPASVLIVFNKADLIQPGQEDACIKALNVPEDKVVLISAKTGMGIDRLKTLISNLIFEVAESKITLSREEFISASRDLEQLRENAYVSVDVNVDGSATALIRGPVWALDRFKAQLNRIGSCDASPAEGSCAENRL